MTNVAIVIGHTSARKGAVNYLGEQEYTFNERIAWRVNQIMKGNVKILYKNDMRDFEYTLKNSKIDMAIELHFNYFIGNASGCEALVLDGTSSHEVSQFLLKLSNDFGIRNRGVKTLDPYSRGYDNLSILDQYCAKCFILEPCFQNDEAIFQDEESYALLIAKFLQNYTPTTLQQPTQESLWKRLLAFLWGLFRF